MDLLPGDVLADVFGRLMPRSLAACRCVCKPWCAVVDAHRLLRKDLLPLSLAGIFVIHYTVLRGYCPPTFFSRPSIGAKISGNLVYLDAIRTDWSHIAGHCNGLLLYEGVVNPATRQWARLPPYPRGTLVKGFFQDAFLTFDPTVSSHFEVFFMDCVLHRFDEHKTEIDLANPNSEWPPSPYIMSAFSSKTWRWEERSFIRGGVAVRSIASVLPFLQNVYRHAAVYWRGRLYVLNLGDNKYRVIQLPPMNEACGSVEPHFGKSEKGVYYGFVHGWCRLQIWFLNESSDETEWMLKHDINLKPSLANFPWKHGDGSLFVQGVKDDNDEAPEKEKPEWDSDNDDGITANATKVSFQKRFSISLLGFHPYKEIVFLDTSSTRVMAYHLNSSKLEDLGCLPLDGDDEIISSSFTYTPCWTESYLGANSLEAKVEL